MKLGQRIAALRNRKHLTQDQMAEALGVKRARYNAWENGISNPDHEMLVALAKYHKVTVDYLLGHSQPESHEADHQSDETKDRLESTLKFKEELDIAADLERMLSTLASKEALAFHGEPMDEESKELLRASLETSMRLAKMLAKEKFNPNKNK